MGINPTTRNAGLEECFFAVAAKIRAEYQSSIQNRQCCQRRSQFIAFLACLKPVLSDSLASLQAIYNSRGMRRRISTTVRARRRFGRLGIALIVAAIMMDPLMVDPDQDSLTAGVVVVEAFTLIELPVRKSTTNDHLPTQHQQHQLRDGSNSLAPLASRRPRLCAVRSAESSGDDSCRRQERGGQDCVVEPSHKSSSSRTSPIMMAVFSLFVAGSSLSFVVGQTEPALGADAATSGQVLFQANCAGCHGGGRNYIKEKKTLQRAALEKYVGSTDAVQIQKFVRNGLPHKLLPFAREFSDEDYARVASFVSDQAVNEKW